jgi:hypothetical protein
MRNKFLFSMMFLFIIVGLYVPASYSQNPTFTITLTNDQQTDGSHYQFDVYLLNSSVNTFELAGIQLSLSYTNTTKGTGTMTAAWDFSATGLNSANAPLPAPNTTTAGVIKAASKAPPGSGLGTIISTNGLGTFIGTLKLSNTVPFSLAPLGIAFILQGQNAFYTKVSAYVAGSNVELTSPLITPPLGTYTNTLANPTLPVELTSFLSNVNGRQINLNWETKTEVNFNKFEIERSLVSTKEATVTWASVGNVQASGTSSAPKKYSYTEKNLQAGKYQYRLKMIDNDGSFKYSSVQSAEVAMPKDFAVSQNYPNPFNPTTTIVYQVPVDAKVIMEVYNIAGQKVSELVNQDMSAGYYTANFSSSNLASGVYIYRVVAVDKASGNNFSSIKKMMLLK